MKKNKGNGMKTFVKVTFVIYLLAVFYITFLSRESSEIRKNLHLFESYINFFIYENDFYLEMIVKNIIMTIPFGIYLPLLFKSFRSGVKVTLAGFLYSLSIELSQYVTGRGLFELDDLFNNTIGAAIGYLLYLIMTKIIVFFLKKK